MGRGVGINRRDFLRLAAGTAVAGGVAISFGARGAGAARGSRTGVQPGKIGIQLYSVRDQTERDFEGTLAAIAGIGYAQVEFAGLYGRSPESVKATIDGLGLTAPSSHDWLLVDDPEPIVEQAAILGQSWTIHPYFRDDSGLDPYKRMAEALNRAGEIGRQYGVKAGYHNHDHEFAPVEGSYPYAVLMDETDPELVDLELDLYWALDAVADYGNEEADPLALFDRAPGRFTLFHVKDGVPNDPARDPHFEDVGEGVIDFAPIFAAKKQAGVKHYITERDDAPGDPEGSLGSAEDMYDNLVAEYGVGGGRKR